MSTPLPPFGTVLRQARQVNGLGRNELAHAAGIDPSFITRLENAERMPGRRVVERLALILEAPLDPAFREQLFWAAGYLPEPSR